ncbi:MAG: Nif3-like dinuclear metal center hexameric protein [Candidatus Pacebacteria bacterium]|nr:Nif3-like dinuclear metal center hexameric protein [Candidatus Paceibacterota bacterium]MDD5012824.1 Nif3-like dinuclear metal center hexameric protein [Candidatus Paceibacterota bacterium]MDD5752564.1 Nif3-like dinuclear metal center hexameric protein [Candidatus Paceibacterota bacterium]
MKTKEIFDLGIKMGINADFRGQEGISKMLLRKKIKYDSLSENAKKEFDLESLENPFLDSRIHNISEDGEIKKIIAGIDIDTGELLLAKQIGVDLVIGHHPIGRALSNLADVMNLQSDVLNYYGVPINIAEKLMHVRINEVARGVNASNHNKVIDASKLLNLNLINLHTPCDNLVAKYLKDLIEKRTPERVEDLINLLKEIPEYKEAGRIGVGPTIFTGNPESRCGKIVLTEITGGTSGSSKLYEKMAQAGIGTIIGMHMSEEHKKEAEAANLNVVIAGHISSDSIGMNLFLDELEKQGIEIVSFSGLIRIKR